MNLCTGSFAKMKITNNRFARCQSLLANAQIAHLDQEIRIGRHQHSMLEFAAKYPGPHSLTSNRSDPSHAALDRLCARGLMVKIVVGDTVMFEMPESAT